MGRLISNRMSYRNHYMCSGKATSQYCSTTFYKYYNNCSQLNPMTVVTHEMLLYFIILKCVLYVSQRWLL